MASSDTWEDGYLERGVTGLESIVQADRGPVGDRDGQEHDRGIKNPWDD